MIPVNIRRVSVPDCRSGVAFEMDLTAEGQRPEEIRAQEEALATRMINATDRPPINACYRARVVDCRA
jgi:hypothetical protein